MKKASEEEKWSKETAKKLWFILDSWLLKSGNLVAVGYKGTDGGKVRGEEKIKYDYGLILYFRNKKGKRNWANVK